MHWDETMVDEILTMEKEKWETWTPFAMNINTTCIPSLVEKNITLPAFLAALGQVVNNTLNIPTTMI